MAFIIEVSLYITIFSMQRLKNIRNLFHTYHVLASADTYRLTNINKDIRNIQEKFLMKILKRHRFTEFGRKCGFENIHSTEEFQKKVPFSLLKDYHSYHEKMKNGHQNILYKEPVFAWLSVGNHKEDSRLIPINKKGLKTLLSGVNHLFSMTDSGYSPVFDSNNTTKALFISNEPEIQYTDSVPVCNYSGLFYFIFQNNTLSGKFLDPGLHSSNIKTEWKAMLWEISKKAVTENVGSIIGCCSHIIRFLTLFDQIYKYRLGLGDKSIREIWPNLRKIVVIGNNLKNNLTKLKNMLDDEIKIDELFISPEIGLIASQHEMKVDLKNQLNHFFFEFVPVNPVISSPGNNLTQQVEGCTAKTLADIEPGIHYFMLITSSGGFYRYLTGDVVQFSRKNSTEFTLCGNIHSNGNISTENIRLCDMDKAIRALSNYLGKEIRMYRYYPVNDPPMYHIFAELDNLIDNNHDYDTIVDDSLRNGNSDYAWCRDNCLLQSAIVHFLPSGTFNSLNNSISTEKNAAFEYPGMMRNEVFEKVSRKMI